MPPEGALRRGAHRDFVEELFGYYRAAGRPTLRAISGWITENEELAGTASAETVRRVLVGKVQPIWPTTQAILYALCAFANIDPSGERRINDSFRGSASVTRERYLRRLWDRMIDEEPGLPPPPERPRTGR